MRWFNIHTLNNCGCRLMKADAARLVSLKYENGAKQEESFAWSQGEDAGAVLV